MKLKFELTIISAFLLAIFLLTAASAAEAACVQIGQKVYNDFYCNESLDALLLKPVGAPCVNPFECLNGSCFDSTCSSGYKQEIKARESLLQQIVNLLQGKLPVGYKTISSNSTLFSAFDLNAPSDAPVDSVRIATKRTKTVSAKVNYNDLGTTKPSGAGVTSNPPGILYHYISLATYNDITDDIDYAEINIKIPKSWFSTNGADTTRVHAYRWKSDWVELNVAKTGETTDFISFKVSSPGFSVFAITAFAPAPPASNATTPPTTPPLPSCTDRIQNQDETGIDCGGAVCSACPAVCGNSVIEATEDCESCALDVKCPEEKVCVSRTCINPPFPFWTVFIIAIVAIIVLYFGFRTVTTVQKAKRKELERLGSTITYVINAIKMNMNENEIKDNLLKAGWNTRQIEVAIKEAKKRMKEIKK